MNVDVWGTVSDVVQTVIAAGVACMGCAGLKAWKTQLRGTDQYQTTKNLVKVLLATREEIRRSYSWNAFIMDETFQALLKIHLGEAPMDDVEERKKRYDKLGELGAMNRLMAIRKSLIPLEAETKIASRVLDAPLEKYMNEIRTVISRELRIPLTGLARAAAVGSIEGSGMLSGDQTSEVESVFQVYEDKLLEMLRT